MPESRTVLGQLQRLKRNLEPELSDVDVERLVAAAAERRGRKRVRRSLGLGLGLGATATAAVALFLHFAEQDGAVAKTPPPVVSVATSASGPAAELSGQGTLDLADASRAIALERGTKLAVEQEGPERMRLRLERGRARFEVTRRPERTFEVRAGEVVVRVVGTVFDVELVADRVGVSVEEGAVEVDWSVGVKRLSAGESGWFPPLVMSDGAEATLTEASGRESAKTGSSANPAQPTAPRGAQPTVQELFAEVDAARAGNEPARAAEVLKRILRDHPNDPRAPLAAFTLGRVFLNDLGRPREAAAAFHEVRAKAPGSQFAEDALAREVEAWKRASEPERARALAVSYLERYPEGRHARRVKVLVGLK